MALPVNALTKISGDSYDNPLLPIFTNSDVSGDFGAGLLIDCDFADPDGAGGYAGAFGAGDLIINSAWEHVQRRLIPAATRDSLSLKVAGAYAANQIVVQRTSKGYPHIIVSTVNDTTASGLQFLLPDDIATYILANPGHQYRVGLEETITRVDTSTANSGNTEFVIENTSNYTTNLLMRLEGRNAGSGGTRPFAAPALLGRTAVPDLAATTGDHYKSLGVASFGGVAPATIAGLRAQWQWGATSGGAVHTYRSSIARRLILEDLTVSQAALAAAITAGSQTTEGQTYVAAAARHQALWAMRAASTDYYSGDTFNTPASVLA